MKIPYSIRLAKYGIFCYNMQAATLSCRKEVGALEYILAFIVSVLANIVSYLIGKWLDGDD